LRNHGEIRSLVEKLARYIPSVDIEGAVLSLKKQGFYRAVRKDVAVLEKSLRDMDTSFFGKKLKLFIISTRL